jgi:hypothetical protein
MLLVQLLSQLPAEEVLPPVQTAWPPLLPVIVTIKTFAGKKVESRDGRPAAPSNR